MNYLLSWRKSKNATIEPLKINYSKENYESLYDYLLIVC